MVKRSPEGPRRTFFSPSFVNLSACLVRLGSRFRLFFFSLSWNRTLDFFFFLLS